MRKGLSSKNKKLKEDFTEEEVKLIRLYCQERIYELQHSLLIPDKSYIKFKQKLKEKAHCIETMSAEMWDDLHAMVWNREYSDKRHNSLNLSILKKMEDTDYYKEKVKEFEKAKKIYDAKQKLKGKKKEVV